MNVGTLSYVSQITRGHSELAPVICRTKDTSLDLSIPFTKPMKSPIERLANRGLASANISEPSGSFNILPNPALGCGESHYYGAQRLFGGLLVTTLDGRP